MYGEVNTWNMPIYNKTITKDHGQKHFIWDIQLTVCMDYAKAFDTVKN